MVCGVSLDGMQDRLPGRTPADRVGKRRENHVTMVGHDDKGQEVISRTMTVQQRSPDDVGEPVVRKPGNPRALVQQAIERGKCFRGAAGTLARARPADRRPRRVRRPAFDCRRFSPSRQAAGKAERREVGASRHVEVREVPVTVQAVHRRFQLMECTGVYYRWGGGFARGWPAEPAP